MTDFTTWDSSSFTPCIRTLWTKQDYFNRNSVIRINSTCNRYMGALLPDVVTDPWFLLPLTTSLSDDHNCRRGFGKRDHIRIFLSMRTDWSIFWSTTAVIVSRSWQPDWFSAYSWRFRSCMQSPMICHVNWSMKMFHCSRNCDNLDGPCVRFCGAITDMHQDLLP